MSVTEKKKRTPKPTMSAATRELIKALPLLQFDCENGDNDLLERRARSFLLWKGIKKLSFPNKDLDQLRMELPNIQEFIRDVIRKDPDEERVEENITRLNAIIDGQINLRASYSFEKLSVFSGTNTSPNWKYIICSLIENSFQSLSAEGSLYIGACLHCGGIYKRKRTDEIYDKKTCQVKATKGNASKK